VSESLLSITRLLSVLNEGGQPSYCDLCDR
jgi:hypothetical protein